MKKLKARIKGISPLLQHRYVMQDENDAAAKKKDKQYDNKADAEKAMYRDEKGCYVPAIMLEASMREAAKNFKHKKSNYKTIVQSAVFVDTDKMYMGKETYDEIDLQPVVIQRNRIVRARPKFNDWEVEAVISYDEDRIQPNTIRDILKEAGTCKGIGDYRPRYGRFAVVEFEELD